MKVRRVHTSWLREDGVWVVSAQDSSPGVLCSGNLPGSVYNPDCSLCWLGHAHSEQLHALKLDVAEKQKIVEEILNILNPPLFLRDELRDSSILNSTEYLRMRLAQLKARGTK